MPKKHQGSSKKSPPTLPPRRMGEGVGMGYVATGNGAGPDRSKWMSFQQRLQHFSLIFVGASSRNQLNNKASFKEVSMRNQLMSLRSSPGASDSLAGIGDVDRESFAAMRLASVRSKKDENNDDLLNIDFKTLQRTNPVGECVRHPYQNPYKRTWFFMTLLLIIGVMVPVVILQDNGNDDVGANEGTNAPTDFLVTNAPTLSPTQFPTLNPTISGQLDINQICTTADPNEQFQAFCLDNKNFVRCDRGVVVQQLPCGGNAICGFPQGIIVNINPCVNPRGSLRS